MRFAVCSDRLQKNLLEDDQSILTEMLSCQPLSFFSNQPYSKGRFSRGVTANLTQVRTRLLSEGKKSKLILLRNNHLYINLLTKHDYKVEI